MVDDQMQIPGNAKLDIRAIRHGLGAQVLARRIVYRESVGSTNDIAKRLAESGEPEGTLVIADEQTAGRGRMGRVWHAPARSSILMSLILRPMLAPAQTPRVTIAVSLGACDGIDRVTGLKSQIKWPNDILLNGNKCAGILSEAGLDENRVEYVLVGLGVNVNFTVRSVKGIPPNATTIAEELGQPVSRETLVQSLVREIERYYVRLREGEDLQNAWKSRMTTLGKQVQADTGGQRVQGIAEDLDQDGALLLRQANGSLIRLIAGEVTLSTSNALALGG